MERAWIFFFSFSSVYHRNHKMGLADTSRRLILRENIRHNGQWSTVNSANILLHEITPHISHLIDVIEDPMGRFFAPT